jgi:hypothetical protein
MNYRPRIGRYDPDPDPYFVKRDLCTVNLPAEMLKTVAFIGIKSGGRFAPRATCFFVTYTEFGHRYLHLVTAEHVISGLLLQGHEIWLRVNVYGPRGVFEFPIQDAASVFKFHPENEREPTDVAVCPFSSRTTIDETGEVIHIAIRSFSLDADDPEGFYPNEEFVEKSISLGAEIGIVGLFRSHYGKNQNIPVVRVGNLSALPNEPVFTKYAGHIKAYLVEARSIAGLSGSPVMVFTNTGAMLAQRLRGQKPQQFCALLGLMHGHFDVRNLNEDVVTDEDAPDRGVHTGMGVVVPLEKIIETLRHPDLTAMRKQNAEKLRKDSGASADLAVDDPVASADPPPATDVNPKHREDFNSLLGAAVKTPAQED